MAPVIADYWERAEFPFELLPKLSALGLGGATIQGYGCPVRGSILIFSKGWTRRDYLTMCCHLLISGPLNQEGKRRLGKPGSLAARCCSCCQATFLSVPGSHRNACAAVLESQPSLKCSTNPRFLSPPISPTLTPLPASSTPPSPPVPSGPEHHGQRHGQHRVCQGGCQPRHIPFGGSKMLPCFGS